MPVTKRSDTGAYQVTIGYGGRTHRKTSRAWTHADAKAYERRYLAAIKDAEAGKQPERLIADAIEKWLEEDVPELRSARQTRNQVRMPLPFVRGRKLSEAEAVWGEVKVAMRGKAPSTINHKGRILRQVTRLAWKRWKWIDRPPDIRLLPETPREVFLTAEQVDALIKACPDDRAAAYILLAAYTGIRRGHMLRLTHHDVEGDFLRLDRSGKVARRQLVPLHPRVQAIAKALPLGVSSNALQAAWSAAREATGIECRWHDLRHTCASWLAQAGVPLHTIGEILGHSSPTMTRRYAHLAPSHLSEAMARVV